MLGLVSPKKKKKKMFSECLLKALSFVVISLMAFTVRNCISHCIPTKGLQKLAHCKNYFLQEAVFGFMILGLFVSQKKFTMLVDVLLSLVSLVDCEMEVDGCNCTSINSKTKG